MFLSIRGCGGAVLLMEWLRRAGAFGFGAGLALVLVGGGYVAITHLNGRSGSQGVAKVEERGQGADGTPERFVVHANGASWTQTCNGACDGLTIVAREGGTRLAIVDGEGRCPACGKQSRVGADGKAAWVDDETAKEPRR
jgi:hypothetical protein